MEEGQDWDGLEEPEGEDAEPQDMINEVHSDGTRESKASEHFVATSAGRTRTLSAFAGQINLESPRSPALSPTRSPRSPHRGHGYRDTKELLKLLPLDKDAFELAADDEHTRQLASPLRERAINLKINQDAVQALRKEGPLAQLKNLKDEIANFNALFAKKKAKADKLAAAGKNKLLHIDKVKLVQLDSKFYYEMHHEFDLYESLRFGRFCYNTPEKAEQIAKDQREVEAREAEELRKTQETAVLFLQALARGKKAREYAKLLKMQQKASAAKRDNRSRGSSRGSRGSTRVRVTSCPPSAPVDPNLPQSPWDLFCTWCARGDPTDDTFPKDQKKSSTMDYKEWVAMLRHLAIFPKQVSKQKSLEIFKQANRGAAGDGDNSELDWDEFDLAFRKLAEHLGVHPMDVWAISKPGFKPPEDDIVPMTEGLTELYVKFAAGDPCAPTKGAQTGKRAGSMDGKEFLALLEYLSLMPEGVSKTFAMDTFKRSKAKGAGTDKSELDLRAFESAMRRICRQVGADFTTLHIPPEKPQESQPSIPTNKGKAKAV